MMEDKTFTLFLCIKNLTVKNSKKNAISWNENEPVKKKKDYKGLSFQNSHRRHLGPFGINKKGTRISALKARK